MMSPLMKFSTMLHTGLEVRARQHAAHQEPANQTRAGHDQNHDQQELQDGRRRHRRLMQHEERLRETPKRRVQSMWHLDRDAELFRSAISARARAAA
jgi:hypothetical protein